VLNAAAALIVAGKASGLEEGVSKAQTSIDSGRAARALDRLVAVTNESV
jgi:anthranilate phosphoribosyltransferase